MKFAHSRRDALLEYDEFIEQEEFFLEEPPYGSLKDEAKDIDHRSGISWMIALERFEHAILDYSGGCLMPEVIELAELALKELERHKKDFNDVNYLFGNPTLSSSCDGA